MATSIDFKISPTHFEDRKLTLNEQNELVTPPGWKNVPLREQKTVIANQIKMAQRKGITVVGVRTGNTLTPVKVK